MPANNTFLLKISIHQVNKLNSELTMGALKIECYCNEKQMEDIVDMVKNHLYNADTGEISDLDDMIEDIRIFIEFDTYMDVVNVKTSEIMDSDWDILYEDTAVFNSRLKNIIKGYNRDCKIAIEQGKQIRRDELII